MKTEDCYSIKLENFEGPLEFLLYLVQKNEIDIYDIRLQKITEQFILEMQNSKIDIGAEFIGILGSLLWLKSKMLLPKHEQVLEENPEEESDPYFDVIHQLIDYCQFKQAGKALVILEKEQNAFFSRGISENQEYKRPLGIDHLSLEDLASLFQEVIQKAESSKGNIQEESYRVSDKILAIRNLLKSVDEVPLFQLFESKTVKEELIVIFLAILELMKLGEAAVLKDSKLNIIVLRKQTKKCKDDYE